MFSAQLSAKKAAFSHVQLVTGALNTSVDVEYAANLSTVYLASINRKIKAFG